MPRAFALPLLVLTVAGFSFWAAAQERKPSSDVQPASVLSADATPANAATRSSGVPSAKKGPVKEVKSADDATARFEGERRFKANCARCHAAPQKFPPRMMATIVRHMRVRATLTDEDMRLILRYMTQ